MKKINQLINKITHHNARTRSLYWITLLLVCIAVIQSFLLLWRINHPLTIAGIYSQAIHSTHLTPDYSDWVLYTNKQQQIKVQIPPEWQINEARDRNNRPIGPVTFTPSKHSKSYGTIEAITVQSKQDTPDNVANEKKFDKLYAADNNTEVSGVTKVATEIVQKAPAVVYAESTDAKNSYKMVGWFRKNNYSYYITVSGPKQITVNDVYFFKNFLRNLIVTL